MMTQSSQQEDGTVLPISDIFAHHTSFCLDKTQAYSSIKLHNDFTWLVNTGYPHLHTIPAESLPFGSQHTLPPPTIFFHTWLQNLLRWVVSTCCPYYLLHTWLQITPLDGQYTLPPIFSLYAE